MAQRNDISVLLEDDNYSSKGSLFSSAGSLFSGDDSDEAPDALPTSSLVLLPPMDNTNIAKFLVSDTTNIHPSTFLTSITSYV